MCYTICQWQWKIGGLYPGITDSTNKPDSYDIAEVFMLKVALRIIRYTMHDVLKLSLCHSINIVLTS